MSAKKDIQKLQLQVYQLAKKNEELALDCEKLTITLNLFLNDMCKARLKPEFETIQKAARKISFLRAKANGYDVDSRGVIIT